MVDTSRIARYARKYIEKGWSVVPIPAKEKAPHLKNWQHLRIKKSEISEYFDEGSNIGVLLGKPSHGLVDVDLDCEQAIFLAPSFLPYTERMHGRKSKLGSHFWYRTEHAPQPEKFCDVDGTCLVEIRSTGQQTVVPPSIHPSGERLRWERRGKPSRVAPAELLTAVKRLAAGALIAQHWPSKGSRNEASMALAGALLRAGWRDAEAAEFIELIAQAAHDEEADNRAAVVGATKQKLDQGEKTTGVPRLAELIGSRVVDRFCDWLGIRKDVRKTSADGSASQATRLVALAGAVKLFHTPEQEGFGTGLVEGHRETWRLRDSAFKRWLASQYYKEVGKTPSSQAVADALGVMEGMAQFGGPERKVYVRIGERKGAIYIDLCDPSWQAIKVTCDGWEIITNPPVKFRRSRGMKPLPLPERGGNIDMLKPFLNISGKDSFVLLVSWLVAGLRLQGPFPVLVLLGEAGSAKTTTARVLRELIDPNTSPLRAEPRDVRDLMVAARNSWCVAFDNVSHLPPWLSDALCRLATGGGFSTRELYTDDQEKIFEAMRPVLLNGIDGVVTRGDLMDRSLIDYLPAISAKQRLPEKEFWHLFRKAQPLLLGSLLDALVSGLRRLPTVKLERLPRMADFAEFAVAAEQSFGWLEGTFMRAYDSNLASANALTLDASPLVPALRKLTIKHHDWSGTAAELLRSLVRRANDEAQQRNWPKNPQVLSGQLRRIAPNLRAAGIDVQFDEKTGGSRSKRIITIKHSTILAEFDRSEKGLNVIRRFPRLLGRGYPIRYPRLKSGASDAGDASSEDTRL